MQAGGVDGGIRAGGSGRINIEDRGSLDEHIGKANRVVENTGRVLDQRAHLASHLVRKKRKFGRSIHALGINVDKKGDRFVFAGIANAMRHVRLIARGIAARQGDLAPARFDDQAAFLDRQELSRPVIMGQTA